MARYRKNLEKAPVLQTVPEVFQEVAEVVELEVIGAEVEESPAPCEAEASVSDFVESDVLEDESVVFEHSADSDDLPGADIVKVLEELCQSLELPGGPIEVAMAMDEYLCASAVVEKPSEPCPRKIICVGQVEFVCEGKRYFAHVGSVFGGAQAELLWRDAREFVKPYGE